MKTKFTMITLLLVALLMAMTSIALADTVLFYEDFEGPATAPAGTDGVLDPDSPPTIGTGDWYFNSGISSPISTPYSKRMQRPNDLGNGGEVEAMNPSAQMYHIGRGTQGGALDVYADVVLSASDQAAIASIGSVKIEFLMYNEDGDNGMVRLTAFDGPSENRDLADTGVHLEFPNQVILANTHLGQVDTGINWYDRIPIGEPGKPDWKRYTIVADFTSDTYTVEQTDGVSTQTSAVLHFQDNVDIEKFSRVRFQALNRGYKFMMDDVMVTVVPEPTTMLLIGIGGLMLLVSRSRRRR